MDSRCRRGAPLAVLALALAAPAAGAQTCQFLMLLGRDTVAVERYTRTPLRLEGVVLSPMMGARVEYALSLVADGSVPDLTIASRRPADPVDSLPRQRVTIAFRGDSAFIDGSPGGATRMAVHRGAVPLLNPSVAALEQIVRRARALARDSVGLEVFALAGGQVLPATVSGLRADTVELVVAGQRVRLAFGADGGLRGGAIPAQGIAIVAAPVTAQPLVQARPDYSAPAGAPYTAEEVRVPSPAGFALAGTLTRPAGARRPVPCVVTISGSGLQDRDESVPLVAGYRPFRQIADALARHGIATLRLDDRGFGASGGDVSRATSADFADDVRAALAWLRARPGVDGRRLALLGHSEGGLIAPLVAAEDRSLRALVLLAGPAWTGRREVESQARYAIERDPSIGADARDSLLRLSAHASESSATTNAWWRWFLDYDPLPAAGRVRTPVLVLQGATDRQVAAEQAGELAAALRAGGDRDVTVRILPGVNHLFLDDPVGDPARYPLLEARALRPEILDLITGFLHSRLGASR